MQPSLGEAFGFVAFSQCLLFACSPVCTRCRRRAQSGHAKGLKGMAVRCMSDSAQSPERRERKRKHTRLTHLIIIFVLHHVGEAGSGSFSLRELI